MPDIKLKRQKIIKVGNSYAVTLDKDFVKQTGLKVGETMVASYDATRPAINYSAGPSQQQNSSKAAELAHVAAQITPELQAWVEKFYKENKEAMKELANL